MISIRNLESGYRKIKVLQSISLELPKNNIISIIGSNGAGKSTLLNTISGLVTIFGGEIIYNGSPLPKAPHRIVRAGIVQVPEGRKVFSGLTVHENMRMGAFTQNNSIGLSRKFDEMYELFPILKERSHQMASTLSGGEQQMLAIARGLMANPKLLLLDEPSLGLAPMIIENVFNVIKDIRLKGITVLLVEQNANKALQVCDYAYVLENGSITLEGEGAALAADQRILQAYLGVYAEEEMVE